MKRVLSFVLCLGLLLGLCGCSYLESYIYELDAETYRCVSVTINGQQLPASEVYSGETSIRFSAFGVAELIIDGQKIKASWRMDKGILSVTVDGAACPATIGDGIVTLDIMGLVLTFAADDAEYIIPERAHEASLAYWNSGWYGWWYIYEADGEYEELLYSWWDACGRFDLDEQGLGLFTLWDELSSVSEPLALCEVQLVSDADGSPGHIESGTGWFMDDYGTIEAGDWYLDPAAGEYPDCIEFGGYYEDESGGFSYYFMMRPWGVLWDDVESADPDSMPYYYYDWYLPLIEGGRTMPATIEMTYGHAV